MNVNEQITYKVVVEIEGKKYRLMEVE